MPPSPYLHPMSPDSLRPRPAPQAAAAGAPVQLSPPPPRPAPEPLWEEEPEVPTVDTLFEEDLFFLPEEDDEDDDEPDAMPPESMPVPVCVPLYDLSLADVTRRKRKK